MRNEIQRLGQRLVLLAFGVAGLALMASGCATAEKQVQRAAKDWCMTIRGSQVIPVYPLTEDLQPGDIFLVQVPVDRQQEIYRHKGFLPLDNHLARLNPSGFGEFYARSFLDTNRTNILPRDWIRPHGVGLYFGTNASNTHSWLAAPRAAFPSYTFSVRNGAGLSLAVPVQGVPVGLSLLASDAASGSIQIQDARTMGVDTVSLYDQLRAWAASNAAFLHYFGASASEPRTNFLRVVTRVYASGRMVVNLKDASNRSAGLDVGAPKPVNLLLPELPSGTTLTPEATLRNFTNSWNAISELVKLASTAKDAAGNVLPGGSLRLAAASARSVTLDETFDPPLILGYLAFDCAIFRGGILGPPIPTHAVLDPNFNLGSLLQINPIYGQLLNLSLYGIISTDKADPKAGEITAQLDALKACVPDQFVEYSSTVSDPNNFVITAKKLSAADLHPPGVEGYRTFHEFENNLAKSIAALKRALLSKHLHLKGAGDVIVEPAEPEARRQLQEALSYYTDWRDRLREDPRVQRAISNAHGYYLEQLAQ